jgi:hypothetical protein
VSSDTRTASPHQHVCFAYDDPATLAAHARGFLADGVAAGQRVWYVAPDRPAGTPAGTRFVDIGAAYPGGAVVDPDAQVAGYAAATRQALAEGCTGLRVMADATSLVRTPEQLAAFTRYEFLADRLSCDGPFAAMCAYDRRVIGDEAVSELAAVHASTNDPVPFHLRACPSADGTAALTGELDLSTGELLGTALERADLRPAGGEVVLAAGDLRFADHRALVRLDAYGARHGTTVVLRDAPGAVARLVALLDLTRVRVEPAR